MIASPTAKTRKPPTSFPARKYFVASSAAAITSPEPSIAHRIDPRTFFPWLADPAEAEKFIAAA